MEELRKFNYQDQVIGGLIGNATGDALGLPVDFSRRKDLKVDPVLEMQGFGSYLAIAGTWSMNTSMSIALMESVQECKAIITSDIMHKLSKWLYFAEYTANHEIVNVNTTVNFAVKKFKRGVDPQDCGDNFDFIGDNGALARIMPIALLCHEYDINGKRRYDLVSKVTRLTHATEKCIMANLVFVNYICYLMDGYYPIIALQRIQQECYNFFSNACVEAFDRILIGNLAEIPEDEIRSTSMVIDTLEAAMWSLATTRNFEQAVIRAVNLGNDTDTVGAVTGAMAGVYYGIQAIPKRWLNKLIRSNELEDIATRFAKTKVIFDL